MSTEHLFKGSDPEWLDRNKGTIIANPNEFEGIGLPSPDEFKAEFMRRGFAVDSVIGAHVIHTDRGYIPAHLEAELLQGPYRALVDLTLEPYYEDSKGRPWQSRVAVFPQAFEITHPDGRIEALHIPRMVQEIAYQILVSEVNDPSQPAIYRNDSICTTSMIDGHNGTNGHSTFGCDCRGQRELGKDIIFPNQGGGASILCPWPGRANGGWVHFGQHNVQSYWYEHFGPEGMPTTYQTHSAQGFVDDKRTLYYPMDAMMVAAVQQALHPESPELILLTNNPDKLAAVEAIGLSPCGVEVHDHKMGDYYDGANFLDKVSKGGHKPPRRAL